MQDGYITGAFNALNQPLGIWSFAYWNTPNWMFFGYDPLGRRVKRWVNTWEAWTPGYVNATYFYYDGWNMVQEGSAAGTADRIYVHGGRVDEIVASAAGGTWLNHHYDARGHCILLTNPGGNIIEQYDYDAFGRPYFYDRLGNDIGSSPWQNRFLFTGREWIKDLRLYDYRHRMYQPELGRFLQPDPKQFAAGDYNLYRYCHNDPVNKSDPMGLAPDLAPLNSESMGTLQWQDMPESYRLGVAAGAVAMSVPAAIEAGSIALTIRGVMLARAAVPAAVAANNLVPKVADGKLGNLVRDLYKGAQAANRVGTGSTADAVRRELATGQATGGKFHSEKAAQYIRALSNWQRANPDAVHRDKMVAETLKRDLKDALRGR